MIKNNKIRKILTVSFTLLLHILTYFIFVKTFSRHYLGLRFASRTLLLTTITFVSTTVWMISVYGKIEIGEKKSKPLFHTITLNLFITNILSFLVLRVMTYHDKFSLTTDLVVLFLVYVVQLLVSKLLINTANSIYFLNYIPEKTLLINCGSEQYEKINRYLSNHTKQYAVTDAGKDPTIQTLSVNDYQNIFFLGNNRKLLDNVIIKSMFNSVNIYYEADIHSINLSKKEMIVVDDILLFKYVTNRISGVQAVVKRGMDIVFSSMGLIIASPVMLVVAMMIKLDDSGPVFFTQERVTRNGEIFKIFKFRSMKTNVSERPATENDDRITRAGQIIRKFRVDELPQLLNIIKGDMSIVGPRPETVTLTQKITKECPEFSFRLKVKAGLTGTAQIMGRYNTKPMNKVIFDLYYIENFTILYDLKLMFQTLIVFLKKDSTEGFEE